MIPSRMATKEEILLVHNQNFYDGLETTKTATRRELQTREGKIRSVEYTNVIHIYSYPY